MSRDTILSRLSRVQTAPHADCTMWGCPEKGQYLLALKLGRRAAQYPTVPSGAPVNFMSDGHRDARARQKKSTGQKAGAGGLVKVITPILPQYFSNFKYIHFCLIRVCNDGHCYRSSPTLGTGPYGSSPLNASPRAGATSKRDGHEARSKWWMTTRF